MSLPRGKRKDTATHRWVVINGMWVKCRRGTHHGHNILLVPKKYEAKLNAIEVKP
ncbi:hypothetical protein pEaSNUABM29_00204 [Erwinia phage pEa_SNUABM_29]|nr:hypothetical protein pEaSNUABM29_00204 [Erwinia phage pEa_SNUABM_29]